MVDAEPTPLLALDRNPQTMAEASTENADGEKVAHSRPSSVEAATAEAEMGSQPPNASGGPPTSRLFKGSKLGDGSAEIAAARAARELSRAGSERLVEEPTGRSQSPAVVLGSRTDTSPDLASNGTTSRTPIDSESSVLQHSQLASGDRSQVVSQSSQPSQQPQYSQASQANSHMRLPQSVSQATQTPQKYLESFAQTPTKTNDGSDGIYLASYSNVEVLEFPVNGQSVMRRVHDSALNATQILKLAGLDKAKRTKMIDRDIQIGEHEKVQGGYGKYQGTWVPFQRGVQLCEQFSLIETLAPILNYDMAKANSVGTPSKESMRRRLTWEPVHTTSPAAAAAAAAASTTGMNTTGPTSGPAAASRQAPLQAGIDIAGARDSGKLQNSGPIAVPSLRQAQNQFPGGSLGPAMQSRLPAQLQPQGESNEYLKVGTVALLPVEPDDKPESVDAFERSRDIVTELFLDLGEQSSLASVLDGHTGLQVDVDVPIDDSGHTALHWAAALARLDLVRDLVLHGAQCRRGNYAGESPLVRAILVTNNSNQSSFSDLLDILYPSLHLADNQGRTVLHHIALTAGIKGRSDASQYYLETLLEWVVRRGSSDRRGFNWLVEELVNATDHNGDTALNIAARISNQQIARQLIDVGASVTIPNRAGLRPVDFGVEVPSKRRQFPQFTPQHSALDAAMTPAGDLVQQPKDESKPSERRKQVVEKLSFTLAELNSTFEQELGQKEELFQSVHHQLKEATAVLNNLKDQEQDLQHRRDSVVTARARVNALVRAVEVEDSKFRQETGGAAKLDLDVTFDADQPFRMPQDGTKTPLSLLDARVAAYAQNEQRLMTLRDELRASSRAHQAKYRRVVSQCTGEAEDKIDSLLSSLTQEVESESGGVDLSRVAGFLKKLER